MGQPTPIQFRGELDNQPIYNIKAVVEATGLTAATLRAWERRYGGSDTRPYREAAIDSTQPATLQPCSG